jgi:hypothetical protein
VAHRPPTCSSGAKAIGSWCGRRPPQSRTTRACSSSRSCDSQRAAQQRWVAATSNHRVAATNQHEACTTGRYEVSRSPTGRPTVRRPLTPEFGGRCGTQDDRVLVLSTLAPSRSTSSRCSALRGQRRPSLSTSGETAGSPCEAAVEPADKQLTGQNRSVIRAVVMAETASADEEPLPNRVVGSVLLSGRREGPTFASGRESRAEARPLGGLARRQSRASQPPPQRRCQHRDRAPRDAPC